MNTGTHGSERRRSLWKSPALVAAFFVSILLVASRLVEGWNWPPATFVVVGAIIFTLGFSYQLVTRNRDTIAYRAAVGVAFAAGFVLMWGNFVQMADVTPFAAMYFGVPIVGLIGAAVARLRPNGMAHALVITAFAQGLVLAAFVILLIARKPQATAWTAPEWRGLCGNAFTAMMFGVSGLLFRKAGRDEYGTIESFVRPFRRFPDR